MKNLIIPILLQLLGVAIIIAEFILPTSGVLGVIALAVFGYSLFLVFTQVSTEAGFVFLLADLIIIPVLVITGIKMLAKSKVSLHTSLDTGDGSDEKTETLLGKNGVTLTDLRPAGVALIDGKRIDVVSKGDFILKDNKVLVTAADGNRIVVKLMEN
ncbi:MAG: serine protease [Chitinispirillia bacterium]|nr:serine protease [Chitinispirillia bacterium]